MDYSTNFRDPSTLYAFALIHLHHKIVWFLIFVLWIVYWSFLSIVRNYNWNTFSRQNGIGRLAYQQAFWLKVESLIQYGLNFFIYLSKRLVFELSFFNYRMLSRVFTPAVELYKKNNVLFLPFFIVSFSLLQQRLENTQVVVNWVTVFAKDQQGRSITYEEYLNSILKSYQTKLMTALAIKGDNTKLYLSHVDLINKYGDFFDKVRELTIEKYGLNWLYGKFSNKFYYNNGTQNQDKDFINKVQSFNDNLIFEYIWTLFPSLVIFLILIPSLYLLYSLEEDISPRFLLKVIGHQWFWSYELDLKDFNFSLDIDSNLVIEDDLTLGSKRLLEVDNSLSVPLAVPFRVLITSSDVLHAWALPELAIKTDAVPGRLNDVLSLIVKPGRFYGQCSELCGVGHGFMPIVVDTVPFKQWVTSYKITEAIIE